MQPNTNLFGLICYSSSVVSLHFIKTAVFFLSKMLKSHYFYFFISKIQMYTKTAVFFAKYQQN